MVNMNFLKVIFKYTGWFKQCEIYNQIYMNRLLANKLNTFRLS